MNSEREAVLDKVRKLYALAGSSNEGEAKAALQAADALVQKYRIEQQELGGRPAFSLDLDPVETVSRASVWRELVLGSLCRRYGCKAVYDPTGVFLFGTADDMAIVRVLYDRISLQLNAMAVMHAKGRGRLFADSFRTGVARAIVDMICPEKEPEASSSTALALADRGDQATGELRKVMPGLELRPPPYSHINPEAYREGRVKGKHIHLGESLGGAPKGALPGKVALPGWEDK